MYNNIRVFCMSLSLPLLLYTRTSISRREQPQERVRRMLAKKRRELHSLDPELKMLLMLLSDSLMLLKKASTFVSGQCLKQVIVNVMR